jgi:hypothetical protein
MEGNVERITTTVSPRKETKATFQKDVLEKEGAFYGSFYQKSHDGTQGTAHWEWQQRKILNNMVSFPW